MKPPRRRVRRLAIGAGTTAVIAVLATIAITSDGTTTRRMDLGDAAVWVANERLHAVGRANTAVLELNSLVETGGDRAVVVQRGADVLVLDPERAGIDIVDPVSSVVEATVAAPPDTRTLAIAGSRAVIGADGDVWIVPLRELERFDGGGEPDLGFGRGTLLSVDDAGTLFAFTPATGAVARVDAADSDRIVERWQLDVDADHDYRLSSVGGRWAVYDADERTLRTADREIDLAASVAGDVEPQAPSAAGERLVLAHRAGLVEIGLADGSVRALVEGRAGVPAAPVRHLGCRYAAWADGTGWRDCPDAEPELVELARPPGAPDLVFRTAGDAIVLNDARSGRSWAAGSGYGLIDNWDAIRDTEQTQETVERPDPDTPPTIEKAQTAPVAVDDRLGARPGRSTILPVLLNDSDANGDVLVIESVDEVPDGVSIDIVADGQQLQLRADEDTASFSFAYTIGDGRGGRDSARVEVGMRPFEVNAPPEQLRATGAVVEAGGRITRDVLADWVDPDGDPVFLQSAASDGDDLVTHTPEGRVVVTDGGGSAHAVRLLVSDGRDVGSGVVDVEVRAAGGVPLVADPFVVQATADTEVEIRPLEHVRGGSAPPRLSAVPARADARITTDFDAGRFRFASASPGTHLLEYSVTDGRQTATGTVRVEVIAPPDRDTVPITVPHTAFLRVGQPADADVLATDIDPMGGVLLVTSAETEADGVSVEVVEHRVLRVTLTAPLEQGSASIAYRVSNGLAEAAGELRVVELPEPVQRQPPTAQDDTASVRVGGVVDVPVLANDLHPDGERLALDPVLVEPPEDGFAFASGDTVRYVAGDGPGTAVVAYRVTGPDGQFATATVRIAVREEDAATNTPPAPPTVDARVLAGQTVRVRIPLTGTDADGDAVQFIGQDSAPERGAVTASGGDWLEYRAGEYSAGTDAFDYTVTDALGAEATGTVRIGIAPRTGGARPPVAVEDAVTVRPGASVAVRVLANDTDPDGGTLEVVDVEATGDEASARVDGDLVRVDAPQDEGRYGFVTTIGNERNATAQSFLVVEVDEDAPPVPPVASDTVLTLSDIQDRTSIDVDVLRNVFVPEGDAQGLAVGLLPGFDAGASVRPDGTIRVEIAERARVVPFVVGDPDDAGARAYAVIRIPGSADAIPQLRKDAPAVVAVSGRELRIPLADVVVAAAGRPVRLVDPAAARATHGDGQAAATDAVTLRYRSEPGYFGPASIAFTVADGDAGDPDTRTAALVLPVEVTPAEGQPPSFVGGVLDFEQGATRTVDLLKLTSHADPDDLVAPVYRLLDPRPAGFEFRLDGTRLAITAAPDADVGTRARIGIGVQGAGGEGGGGRIELRVVASTRPLARPAADEAPVERGATTVVDVLANDRATNPFPGKPLRVVGLRGLDRLPDGVRIVPNDDGSKLSVTVAADAEPVNTAIDYEVADATGDPSRHTWGRVVVSVQDRPDPVTQARLTGFGDRSLDLVFAAGAANNAPITGFEVVARDLGGEVVSRTDCETTSCRIPTGGNGRDHAVEVQIAARNAVGASEPVSLGDPVWSDVVPPAPSGVTATPIDGGLRLGWPAVDTGAGSAVDSYVVTVAGRQSQLGAASICSRTRCSVDWGGLTNGTAVSFTVSARNEAYPAFSRWAEAGGSGTPSGAPVPGTITVAGDAANGRVTVAWSPFSPNGDAVRGYLVQRLTADASGTPTGPQACRVTEPAPGELVRPATGGTVVEVVDAAAGTTSLSFDGLGNEAERYNFIVWGWNGSGCTSTEVAGVVVRPAPGAVNGLASDMRMTGTADAPAWDRYLRPPTSSHASVEIVAVDQRGSQIPGTRRSYQGESWPRQLLNRPYGETVRFQLRGCTLWGSCGPWSEVLPAVGTDSPSLTFRLPGRSWNAESGTWSWTGDPDNSGIPVTAYRCGIAGTAGTTAQTATSCTVPGAARPSWMQPDQWSPPKVWLDVEIGGVVARFER